MSSVISLRFLAIFWILTVLKVAGNETCNLKAVNGKIEYKFLTHKDYENGCNPSPLISIALENFHFNQTPELDLEFQYSKIPDVTVQIGSNHCYTAMAIFDPRQPPPNLRFRRENGAEFEYPLITKNIGLQQNWLYIGTRQPQKILCGFLVRRVGKYKIIEIPIVQDREVESVSLVIKSTNRTLKLADDLPLNPNAQPQGDLDLFFELNEYWWPLSLFVGFIDGTFLGIAVGIIAAICILKKPNQIGGTSTESVRETMDERDGSQRKGKKKSKAKNKK